MSAPIYYLSFHIAPPAHARWGECVAIAPNVQNDLREQVYVPGDDEEGLRIGMAWVGECGSGLQWIADAGTVEWYNAHQAYQPVQVALPTVSSSRGIERVRLALFERQSGNKDGPWEYNIGRHADRMSAQKNVFVPLLSSTIRVGGKKASDIDDQSNLPLRIFKLNEEADSASRIAMYEQPGFALEGHLWDAALDLVSWIVRTTKRAEWEKKRIIELGAGTGLVSIALSSFLRSSTTPITATDLPLALDLLQQNSDANRTGQVECRSLDWELIDNTTQSDIVLVADCTYNPSYFKALCKAIFACLSNTRDSVCYLAKKHRHIDEESLWPAAGESGLRWRRVAGSDCTLRRDSDHACQGAAIYEIRKCIST